MVISMESPRIKLQLPERQLFFLEGVGTIVSVSGAIFFSFLKFLFTYLFLAVLGLCCFAWDSLVVVSGATF